MFLEFFIGIIGILGLNLLLMFAISVAEFNAGHWLMYAIIYVMSFAGLGLLGKFILSLSKLDEEDDSWEINN